MLKLETPVDRVEILQETANDEWLIVKSLPLAV